MNRIPDLNVSLWHCLKNVGFALVALVAMCLAACGPGSGGTGIGPRALSGTYVSAATGISAGGSTSSVAVPGIVLSASPDANFVVVFDAERVTLNNACLAFTSQGARIESEGQLQIDGLFRVKAPGIDPAATLALPATLVARVDGAGLQVTLRTPAGALVASFNTSAQLPPGTNPAPAGACVATPG